MSLKDRTLDKKRVQQTERKPTPLLEEFGVDGGTATAVVSEGQAPDWSEVLCEILPPGFAADDYEIVSDSVRISAWDVPGHERQYSYRARVRRRSEATELGRRALDLAQELTRTRASPAPRKGSGASLAFVVPVGDTQWGKADGDGVEGTLRRWNAALPLIGERVEELRSSGRDITEIWIPGMGDLVEGCGGDPNYPGQDFTVEIDNEDQRELAEITILQLVDTLAPLAPSVKALAIGGNHGQYRANGSKRGVTGDADNKDVGIFRGLKRLASRDPKLSHLEFHLAQDERDLTLPVCGTTTTFAHGDQFGRGSTPGIKAQNWWAGQAHNMRKAGASTLLLSAHYHHLLVIQSGHKTHIQIPAMDGGSKWWEDMTGDESPSGILTMLVGGGGWRDLEVIRPWA